MNLSAGDLEEIMDKTTLHDAESGEVWTECDGSEGHDSPLSILCRAEDERLREAEMDAEDFEALKAWEVRRLRAEAIRLQLVYLAGDPAQKPDLTRIGSRVAMMCWEAGIEPFASMKQTEIAELEALGRAAVCERHKKLMGKKQGKQKAKMSTSANTVAKLVKAQQGNKNRSGAAGAAVFAKAFGGAVGQ